MVGPVIDEYRMRKTVYKSPAYSRIFYEVWIMGERVYIHRNVNQWSDYRNIKFLRKMFRLEIILNRFEIYKIVKSQPTDGTEAISERDRNTSREVAAGI